MLARNTHPRRTFGLVLAAAMVTSSAAVHNVIARGRPVAHRAAIWEGDEGEEGGVVREPMAWGCSDDAVATSATRRPDGARAAIPPRPLRQDISDLRVGRPFPAVAEHNLAIKPEQLASVEQEFCRRDGELACPVGPARERIVANVLERTARIAAKAQSGSAEARAARRMNDELRQNRLPLVLFTTDSRNGPTAGILRFFDAKTKKWILGIAFAKDFMSLPADNSLFLDGVLVQEMVHYDDLSFLPDPLRCYESNLEIRGHYAMIRYWQRQHPAGTALHPRIAAVLHTGLDSSSRRSAWYRYLNQVEKTDFLVEDELVTLEFQSLPTLSAERADDQRFLRELATIVSGAVHKATFVQSRVASLSSDTINASARTISAVSRLAPRVVGRYERARAGLRDATGVSRTTAMGDALSDIRRSLDALNTLMGALAANPDFRRKSEFVGPE